LITLKHSDTPMWQPLRSRIVCRVAILLTLAFISATILSEAATLVITIPCDPNMTNYTTTLMSNTNYLIQDCTLSNLSHDSNGDAGWLPRVHRFTASLSTQGNITLINVRIVVRGGNIMPLVKIQSTFVNDSSTMSSVRNVSLLIVGSNIVWPAAMQPNVVDTIFTMSYVFLRNVTLTVQECMWNLTYPNSVVTGNNPILLYIKAPLLLFASSLVAPLSPQELMPGGVRVVLINSNVGLSCSSPNTPSGFIIVEMPNSFSETFLNDVAVAIVRSSLSISVSIWFRHQLVSVLALSFAPGSSTLLQAASISNVSATVYASNVSISGVLPYANATTVATNSGARMVSVSAGNCSDVEVMINGRSNIHLSLTRLENIPATIFAVTGEELRGELLSVSAKKHMLRCSVSISNTRIVLRAPATASVVTGQAPVLANVHIVFTNVALDATIAPGLVGQQKIYACVSLVGAIRDINVDMSTVASRSNVAADGAPTSGAIAIFLSTADGDFKVNLSHVKFESTITTGLLSYASYAPLVNVVIFISTSVLLHLNGNASLVVNVHDSHLAAQHCYGVPTGAAMQFTSALMAIVYVPGGVTASTINVKYSSITIVGINDGVGAVPPLPALNRPSGSWNGNSVAILATFSQTAAYGILPAPIAAFAETLFADTDTSVPHVESTFDSVAVSIDDTSIASSASRAVKLSDANIVVGAVGLTTTVMRNGAGMSVNNFSLLLFMLDRENEKNMTAARCRQQTNDISTTGSGFGPVIGVFGSCVLEASTWIVVRGARGVVGPIVSSYSVAQKSTVLTFQRNSSIQFTDVSAVGLIAEGSIFGKGSQSDGTGTFTINVAQAAMSVGVTGIFLSMSSLCGFGFLVGPQSSVVSATQAAVSLQCNVWSPIPLQQLLVTSTSRLLPSTVNLSSPGKSDWNPNCPLDLEVSNTATPTLVIVPHTYPVPSVRSATSVVVGSSVVAGSLLGGSYGAVHGIQAAMLILRAQALCADGSSDAATPDELCCDLGTSPTQWRLPGYGGVYLGGVVANTLIVLCSTIMRFGTGKLLRRLHLDEKHTTLLSRVLQRLRTLAPPSGPVTLSWTAYMFLLCPTVALCVALASDGTMPAYARWVGGVALLLWLVPWAGAFFGLCWRGRPVVFAFHGIIALRKNEEGKKVSRRAHRRHGCSLPTLRGAHAWLFLETEELAPRRGLHFKEQATEQLRRFGSVFASYRAARYWCFNVEVWFAIATGVATGLMLRQMSSTDPCTGSGWAWAVVGVGILETITALLLRAFALRLELVGFVAVMVFAILSEVVALLNPAAASASFALCIVSALLDQCFVLFGAVEHLLLRHRLSHVQVSVGTDALTSGGGFLVPFPGDAIRRGGRRTVLNANDETGRIERSLSDMIEMICTSNHGSQ
jgi:hypothetical protein